MTREPLTNADFIGQASFIARAAASWAGDTATMPDSLREPMSDEALKRFICDMRDRLDRLWLWGLQWEPAYPKEGEPGSSILDPRQSKRSPGAMWSASCQSCGAYVIGEAPLSRCDECEDRRDAAIAERRSALARANKGGGDA